MNNYEHERGLIGAVLADKTGSVFLDAQSSGITDASFDDIMARRAWAGFEKLRADGLPLTRFHLLPVLRTAGVLTGCDIDIFFRGMEDAAPAPSFAPAFIREVRKAEHDRHLRNVAALTTAALDRGDDPEAVAAEAQKRLADFNGAGVRVKTLRDIRLEVVPQWHEAVGRGFVGIPSGLPELTRLMGGYQFGVVTVLAAYRSTGKSTLARQEAAEIAKLGVPVGIITMEDTAAKAGGDIAGNLGNFSTWELSRGQNTFVPPDHADELWREIEGLPIYIIDAPQNIGGLVNAMTLLSVRYGCRLIVVDHLQYVLPSGKRYCTRNDEVAAYSAQIAATTKRLNVATLLLSQFSRDCEKEGREPRLSDLRDSGAIEQDARAVLLLFGEAGTDRFVLRVAKNNAGPAGGEIRLIRKDGRQRFEIA